MKVIALDFETSGLDPKRHAPVSLGVALFEDGLVTSTFETMIGAPRNKEGKIIREYDVQALEISGASWSKIKNGPSPTQVCLDLSKWVKSVGGEDLAVLAFNAPFDLAFYSELLFMAGGWNQHLRRFEGFAPPLCGPWQCVRLMTTRHVDLPRLSLDAVSEHFGLSRSTDLHGALEDAVLAGHVYHKLCNIREASVA